MISFIIPIYNAEQYLAQCIESIIAQRGAYSLEIILIDDESTDSSLAIAQAYAGKDSRVIVLTQAHAGQSAARNLGLRYAKGEYIAFVDADDYLAPDWCQQHMEAIEGVDYVQSGYTKENKTVIAKHAYQFTSACLRLYRREALQGLSFPEGMIYEDVLFSAQLWCTNATCRQIPYAGYYYTTNPTSTTSKRHKEAEQRIMHELRQLRKRQTYRNKLIVTFTILRLKIHFML